MATEEKPEEWIDRTNETLGEIGNGYELTPTLQHLYLTNNRISKIEKLDNCVALRELVLRQNAIKQIEGIDSLIQLEELDLYMNQIESVPSNQFKQNSKLKRLDLSFNNIRELKGFPSENLLHLEELYLIGNKIRNVSDLHTMPKLVMLELGDNRLRAIENLDRLPSLRGLWLGRNKITRIEGLEKLSELRRLSIQSNRITSIEGLDHLEHLEELYLSHNGITSMQGIQKLKNLQVLDLGVNFIEHIECVENLPNLREFWMNGNKLGSFDELNSLRDATQLETIYLEGNPLSRDPAYQTKVLDLLPDSLEQLDALLVEDVKHQIAAKSATENQTGIADRPPRITAEDDVPNEVGNNLHHGFQVTQSDEHSDKDEPAEKKLKPIDEASGEGGLEPKPSPRVTSENDGVDPPELNETIDIKNISEQEKDSNSTASQLVIPGGG